MELLPIVCLYDGEIVCNESKYTHQGGTAISFLLPILIQFKDLLDKIYRSTDTRKEEYDITLRALYPGTGDIPIPPVSITDIDCLAAFLAHNKRCVNATIPLVVTRIKRSAQRHHVRSIEEHPNLLSSKKRRKSQTTSSININESHGNLSIVPCTELGEKSDIQSSVQCAQADYGLCYNDLQTTTKVEGNKIESLGGTNALQIDAPPIRDSNEDLGLDDLIFNSVVRSHFSIYAWVTVSQNYSIIELLKNIIKQVMGIGREELARMERDDLEEKLYNFLKEKEYFIVMDDVWEKKVWNQIKEVLPNMENGSKVLLTTRSIDIARHVEPDIPPHQLPLLSDEESWKVFNRMVFPNNLDDETSCPKELNMLGRQLTKKCGGLPLALVALGGLLSTKEKTSNVWFRVLNNMPWPSTEDGNQCLDILALSYNDLPYYLKSCFLYLGSFPEDHQIKVNKLIRLWIGEGFVQQREREVMEETATDYLNELMQRCLIQVAAKRFDGSVKKCRIHDLFRDLCIREAKNDQFVTVHSTVDLTATNIACRRAVYLDSNNSIFPYSSSPNLHTLLCFGADRFGPLSFNGNFKLLRVVDLEGANGIRNLPKEVGSMILLRYLGLRRASVNKLPSSIWHLCNLQTLDVRSTSVDRLPNAVWRIGTLRHLLIDQHLEYGSPPRIAGIKDLYTLKSLWAGRWVDRDMAKLTSLRKLGIRGLTTSHGKGLVDSLEKLSHLVSLTLSGESFPIGIVRVLSNHGSLRVLSLRGELVQLMSQQQQQLMISDYYCPDFQQNLSKLTLEYSELKQDPMGSLEKLQNVRALRLCDSAYTGMEMVCSAGGFPRLQHLELSYLYRLKDWRVEDGAMPSLTHLILEDCKGLAMLPEGMQHLTALQELRLYRMSRELVDRVRKDEGQDWYKIQHIPSIVISPP